VHTVNSKDQDLRTKKDTTIEKRIIL
jgi:hypothetical protein